MNQQLQQALARWPEITKTDKFQKYSVEDKRALRDWYFKKYILPFSKDKQDLEVNYKAWTDVTNKDVEPTWGEAVVHGVEKGLLGVAEQAIKRQSPVWWAQEIGKRLIGEHRPEYVQRTEQAVQDWLQQKKEKLAKGAPATFLKSLGAGMAEATVDPLFWVASGLGELGIEQAGKLTTKLLPRLAAESAAMAGAGGAYGLAKGETPKQAGYEALAWGLLHGISRPALSGLGKLWRAFVHDVHPSGEVKPPEITREQFIHANREKLEQFFRWLDDEKAKQIIAKDVEAKQARDFAIQYAKEHPVERTPAETAGMFKTKQPRPSELVEPVVTKVKNLADKENLASIKPLKNFDEAVDRVNKTEQAIKGMVKQTVEQPWRGAASDEEAKWFGTKVTIAPDPLDVRAAIKEGKKPPEPEQVTINRVLNKGKILEVYRGKDPNIAFRIPSDRVLRIEKAPKPEALYGGPYETYKSIFAHTEAGKPIWKMTKEEFVKAIPPGYKFVAKKPAYAKEDIAWLDSDNKIVLSDSFFNHSPKDRKWILEHEKAHLIEKLIKPKTKAKLFDDKYVMSYRGANINEKLANLIADKKPLPKVVEGDLIEALPKGELIPLKAIAGETKGEIKRPWEMSKEELLPRINDPLWKNEYEYLDMLYDKKAMLSKGRAPINIVPRINKRIKALKKRIAETEAWHKKQIQQAIAEGESIPRRVLEGYKGEPWADKALAKSVESKPEQLEPEIVKQVPAKRTKVTITPEQADLIRSAIRVHKNTLNRGGETILELEEGAKEGIIPKELVKPVYDRIVQLEKTGRLGLAGEEWKWIVKNVNEELDRVVQRAEEQGKTGSRQGTLVSLTREKKVRQPIKTPFTKHDYVSLAQRGKRVGKLLGEVEDVESLSDLAPELIDNIVSKDIFETVANRFADMFRNTPADALRYMETLLPPDEYKTIATKLENKKPLSRTETTDVIDALARDFVKRQMLHLLKDKGINLSDIAEIVDTEWADSEKGDWYLRGGQADAINTIQEAIRSIPELREAQAKAKVTRLPQPTKKLKQPTPETVKQPEMTTPAGLGEKGQIPRSLVNVMGRSAAGGLAGASAAKYYHKDPRAGFVIGALAMLGGPAAYRAVMKVPATRTMAKALIKDIDASKNVLDPPLHAKVLDKLINMYHYVELPESAEKLRDIATRHIGAGLRRIAQQEETIKTYHEIFAALPESKRIEFLKQYEKMAEFGGKSPHGILGDIARVFKRMNDENYDYLQPKLERFNKATGRKGAAKLFLAYDTETNFFPRYYKDINRARQFYTGASNASPNFLKARYYTFVEDALKSGLELRSTNPVDMQMFRNIHTAEFGKLLDTVSEALENNLVKVVKPGRRLPKEWDSIALGRLGLLAGPKDVIRSLRYMTSPSLAQHGWYRGLRAIAESNVRANLAFSMAHTLMESVNSSVHHASLAARAFLSGQLERSAKEALYAVPFVAPVKALKKRSLIEAAYLGEKNVPKFAKDVADLMERSGLTIGTRAHFGTKAIKNFKTALLENRRLAAIGHAPFAFFEKIASPIMEYFVPAVKYEAFAHEMEYYLSKNPEEIAKLGGIERIARKVADSIEYRFGEMNYKRKFWNRTARDMGHVSMISVGWNSGTAFEFGGGVTDALRLASGKKVLGTRIGFTLTYPFIVAMMGAVYQYLHTGKEPESTLDLFYPRDGGTNPDGSESRRFILNYLKDAKSLEELGPMRVAAHKMTRIWGTLAEALIWNRDYWNNMIYDPDKDSLLKKGYLVMKHIFGAYNPFVVSNAARAWNEASRESSSWKVINTAENVAGIITAPKYATQTPLQKKIYKVAARVYSRVKTPTEKKQSEIRRQMRVLLQRGKKIPVELFNQARQLGMFQTSRSAKAFLKTATLPNDIRVFSTFPSQIQVELLMGSKNPANVGRYLFYMHKQAAYDYIKLMLVAGKKDVLKQAYLYALHQPQRIMKIKTK